MGEWIRFWIVAAILMCGIIAFIMATVGVLRFGFVMNRMHASGIGDSLGLGCVVIAMIVAPGLNLASLKLLLLSTIEINTNPFIRRHVRIISDESGTDDSKKGMR